MEKFRIGNVTSEAVEKATGKGWEKWFEFLNRKNASELDHKALVLLLESHIESPWWRQKVSSAYEHYKGARVTGQVATGGYQMGMQKTFAMPLAEAWDFLMSEEALTLWLGATTDLNLVPKGTYRTRNGTHGKFNVIKKNSHLRLTWQPRGWDTPSLLQIRVLAKKDKTTISIHHEHLPDGIGREKMKQHWNKILDKLEKIQ